MVQPINYVVLDFIIHTVHSKLFSEWSHFCFGLRVLLLSWLKKKKSSWFYLLLLMS